MGGWGEGDLIIEGVAGNNPQEMEVIDLKFFGKNARSLGVSGRWIYTRHPAAALSPPPPLPHITPLRLLKNASSHR